MSFQNVPAITIEGFRADLAPARCLACLIVLVAALLCLAPPAIAATKTWVAGTGQWDTIGNWSPSGQPQAGDDVNLTQTDATSRTVTYYNTTNPTALLNSLKIDATGTGTMALDMPNDHGLKATTEYIGYSGKGTVTQSAGTNNATTLYLGYNAGGKGTYIVTGGQVSNTTGCLGYNFGSAGTATVTGAGSKWTNSSDLYVGRFGGGTLKVEAGGEVSNGYGYLGYSSTGTATVTGAGSKWTNSGMLNVGMSGSGTLNIKAGGEVSNTYGHLGRYSGSTGTATVTGAASKWTNSGDLYVGESGKGTLNIEVGGQVSNTTGYLGYNSGSTGTATVTGADSKWTNSGSLFVGCFLSTATLTVANGGLVTAETLYASLSDLLGNGTITVTQGAVLDADLIFDGTHGTAQSVSFGTGGSLNLNVVPSGVLGAGYKGSGTLRIAAGVTVASNLGYLGYDSGSTGTATVTDAGSKWTNSGALYVGRYGDGALNIEAGGQVSSTWGYLGYWFESRGKVIVTGAGSKWTISGNLDIQNGALNVEAGGEVSNTSGHLDYGTATVTGAGSKWTNSGSLWVDYQHTGTLRVADGGMVITWELWASSSDLYGDGTITVTKGAVLAADMIFDSAHGGGTQTLIPFGAGGTLNLTVAPAGTLGAGYKGTGTLRIADGVAVASASGYLGYDSGSAGTATVTGTGSRWDNSGDLYVGQDGSGTLNIQAGGEVSNKSGYLGRDFGSNGMATVTGTGSKWTNSGQLFVGDFGNGTLKIEGGGQVSSDTAHLGSYSTGTATVTGAGSMWTSGGLYFDSFGSGSGTLSIEAGGEVHTGMAYLGSGGRATVTGAGSKWINWGELYVGRSGSGTLKVEAGGEVRTGTAYLGENSGSIGTATVTGTDSKWTNSGSLYVGTDYGNGTLNIEAGGQVSNTHGYLGYYYSNSTGTATVTGAGSKWTNSGSLYVGTNGKGTLSIEGGGQVSSDVGYLGLSSGSTGTATVTGVGSKWTNSKDLYVGYYGSGSLNVEKSGEVSNADGYLGYGSGSTGKATVDGAGSTWTNTGFVYVGGSSTAAGGTGSLTVQNGGQVTVGGTLKIWNSGSLTIQSGGGGVTAAALVKSSGGTISWTGGTLGITGAGGLTVGSSGPLGASLTLDTGKTLNVTNTATVNSGSTLTLSGGSLVAGKIANSGTFNWNGGTVQLAAVELNGTSLTTLGAGHDKTLATQALTMAESAPGVPTATLDLTDNRMVIDYSGDPASSPLEQVKAWIKAGWLNADVPWYGPGITSSAARESPDLYTIAFVDQGRLLAETGELWYGPGGTRGETFGGIAVDETSILVKLTYLGDVDLDGMVYDDDVAIMSGNYSRTGPTGAEYWGGDIFGFDGWVYDDEAGIIGGAYNNGRLYGDPLGAAQGQGAIPEPASALLVGIGGILFALRRRGR